MRRMYVLGTFIVLMVMSGCEMTTPGGNLLAPGNMAPEFHAEEWVGGPAPSTDALKGKVVVVDFWAHWCGPCRAAAPGLVKSYHDFADQPVEFLGLTPDGPEARSEIEAFHDKANLPWPTGIGAGDMFSAFGVEYLPTVFVIGRDGKVFWNSGLRGKLDDAIQGALDQEIL